MTDKVKYELGNVSRRSVLLQGVSCATAATIAAAMIALDTNEAMAAKLPQKAVNYRPSPKGNQKCSTCKLFEAPKSCKSVAGDISPNGWCSLYRKA